MRPHLFLLPALLLAPACVTSDGTAQGSITVTGGDPAVIGNHFLCEGTWPSAINPCATPWSSNPITDARATGDHEVTLTLTRGPIAVDGGSSVVTIVLDLDDQNDVIAASAGEHTTHPGDATLVEESAATGGSILPVHSSVADGFQGIFGIDFAWGKISGTYDTLP